MNKYKKRVKSILNERKSILYFFLVLLFVGIIFGSLFITVLDEPDKMKVATQIKDFFSNMTTINHLSTLKSSLISNVFSVLFIWILGASGVGIIVIVLFIFIKGFIFGFSVGAITYTYGFKGALIAFIYLFPHGFINLILLFILSIKSFNLSLSFLKNLFSKHSIDYRLFGKKYLRLLVLVLLLFIVSSIFETYISPILLDMSKPLF